jgi:hypothetical protein
MITNTIRQSIARNSLIEAKSRLARLESSGAPKQVIEGARQNMEALEAGFVFVAHIDDFGDLEYTSVEVKTGRMGSRFISFTTAQGIINYFPNGKYGAFISKQQEKGE